MLQRDYFMRMTEMLAAVLSKVLFNKEKKNYDDAQKEIETAAKTIVGIDLKLISLLSIEDIIQLMKTSDVYAGRCIISAELLKEYGDIFEAKGKTEEGYNFYLKSLRLYIEALLTKELPIQENYYTKINQMIEKLSHLELTNELKYKLVEYFELSKQYSKAEDILFELIEYGDEEAHDKAISFYKRLLNKTDEELINGNLSRDEIEEGLEEIFRLKEE